MRIAFLMDPIEHVLVDQDTTFALMLEAQARGHQVLHVAPRDLWAAGGSVHATVRPVRVQRALPPLHAVADPAREMDLGDLDALLIRTDPPFDPAYLHVTLLLEALRGRVLLVNDPRGLREANEKLYALHFPDVTPRTIVTGSETRIRDFLAGLGTPGVIKPLDGHGGRGVMVLDPADRNFRAIIEAGTGAGRQLVMVQEYLPAVRRGDKRVLVLDGEPLGAILRVPRDDEARSNIHVGGRVEASPLDADDLRIVSTLAPRLRADGLHFVGLDVIGGRLTEVNVTSPTGLQELARLDRSHPEARVLAWIEDRVRGRPGGS